MPLSAGRLTTLPAGRRKTHSSIPAQATSISFLHNAHTSTGRHPFSHLMPTRTYFRSGKVASYLHLSKLRMGGAKPPIPHIIS